MASTVRFDKEKLNLEIIRFKKRTGMDFTEMSKLINNMSDRGTCSPSLLCKLTTNSHSEYMKETTLEAICKLIDRIPESFLIDEAEQIHFDTSVSDWSDPINYDQLYKTIYGAMFAVMDQFWGK